MAAGHTSSDQVETVLYRLAASPGRRALLGMPARDGRLVRPLLAVSRAETTAYCTERGLGWREDPTNAEDGFARGRVRHGLLAALEAIHPAAQANLLRTLAMLREEDEVLDAAAAAALAGAGDPPELARLAALPPALARLALQRLADGAAGGSRAPAIGARADELLALGAGGGSAALDLPGGLRAVAEYGRLRFTTSRSPAATAGPVPTRLPIPGRVAFAGGEVTSRRAARDTAVADGTLDAAALTPPLEVRAWRPGDRMRPLGLGGSRTLQDLFVDRKVPRERRHRLPVVLSGAEIAWVPGVATGERFRVTEATTERVRLAWAPVGSGRRAAAAPVAEQRQGHAGQRDRHQDRGRDRRIEEHGDEHGDDHHHGHAGDDDRVAQPHAPPVPAPGPRLHSRVLMRRDPEIGEILVQADDLQHRVRALGAEISRDYAGRDLLLIGVLKGAVFFLSDLMRHIDVPCEVDFMAVASYGSATDSSGVVRILKDLDEPIEGRDVLIVEDIVDSGLTLQYLLRSLNARRPASLEVCALLTKPDRRKVDLPARYIGFEIPDRFAIGYGLDHAERYRNLPYVAALVEP